MEQEATTETQDRPEAPVQVLPPAETTLELAQREDGVEVVKRLQKLENTLYYACLQTTRPQDWLLTRSEDGDGDEMITAELCASGADRILTLHGACPVVDAQGNELPMYGPVGEDHADWRPMKLEREGDVGYEGWARARSRFTQRSVTVRMARWASEEFAGRLVDSNGRVTASRKDGVRTLETDLKSALHSGLKKKLAIELSGLGKVPVEQLDLAGLNTSKCRLGHGFGKSSERSARKAVSDGIKVEQDLLREEILALVGHDKSAAVELLKEITAWKSKKGSGCFDRVERLTRDWQIENAWKTLRNHPHFGSEVSSYKEVQAKKAEKLGGAS